MHSTNRVISTAPSIGAVGGGVFRRLSLGHIATPHSHDSAARRGADQVRVGREMISMTADTHWYSVDSVILLPYVAKKRTFGVTIIKVCQYKKDTTS